MFWYKIPVTSYWKVIPLSLQVSLQERFLLKNNGVISTSVCICEPRNRGKRDEKLKGNVERKINELFTLGRRWEMERKVRRIKRATQN